MKIVRLISSSMLGVALVAGISADASGAPEAGKQGTGMQATPQLIYTRVGGTIVQTGSGGATLTNDTYRGVDKARKLDCQSQKGCLIVIQAMVQARSDTGGAYWTICAFIDGTEEANPPCPWQGILPTTFQMGNVSESLVVTTGKHTVRTFIYPQANSGSLGHWQTMYTLLQE